jgi:hypothetical protein
MSVGSTLERPKPGNQPKPGNRWSTFYPWEEWFGKGAFTLVHGKDYTCTPAGMVVNLRYAAKRRGVRLSISQPRWKSGTIEVTVRGAD